MIELGFEFQAMASACELHLVGDDEGALRRAAQAAIAEVHRIERKYSRYDAGSLVSRINAAAGSGQAVPVDDETAGLLAFAGRLHALSDGRFDITSGVLRRAWDFRAGRVPGRRRSRGPAAADRLADGWYSTATAWRCRRPAWRSTSAASARSTPPTAPRRCCARPPWPAAMSTWEGHRRARPAERRPWLAAGHPPPAREPMPLIDTPGARRGRTRHERRL